MRIVFAWQERLKGVAKAGVAWSSARLIPGALVCLPVVGLLAVGGAIAHGARRVSPYPAWVDVMRVGVSHSDLGEAMVGRATWQDVWGTRLLTTGSCVYSCGPNRIDDHGMVDDVVIFPASTVGGRPYRGRWGCGCQDCASDEHSMVACNAPSLCLNLALLTLAFGGMAIAAGRRKSLRQEVFWIALATVLMAAATRSLIYYSGLRLAFERSHSVFGKATLTAAIPFGILLCAIRLSLPLSAPVPPSHPERASHGL